MIGQPFNSNNCLFVANQALNAGQFGAVPNTSNQTNHTVLWDFVSNKLYWVNTLTNLIEREIDGAGGIQNEAYEKISVDTGDGYYVATIGSLPFVFGANYLLLPAGTYSFELEFDILPRNSELESNAGNLLAQIRTNTNQALTSVDASDVIQQSTTTGLGFATSVSNYPLDNNSSCGNQTLGTGAATFNAPFIVKSSFQVNSLLELSTVCFNNIQLRALLVK